MASESAALSRDRAAWLAAAGVMALFLLAPRMSLAGVVVLGMLPLADRGWQSVQQDIRRLRRSPVLVSGLLFACYLLVSVTWSSDPVDGIGKFLLVMALLLLGLVAKSAFDRLPADRLQLPASALLAAFPLAAGFLLIEELSGQAVKQAIFSLLPFTRPDIKHVRVDGDLVRGVALYISNRSVAAMVLAIWPVLVIAKRRSSAPARYHLPGLLMTATALTALVSQHETSALALIAGLAVFLLVRFDARLGFAVLTAGWLTATLLVVPIAKGLYMSELHMSSRLPYSTKARVILWNYTADLVPARFWRGVGISSTKVLDEKRKSEFVTLPGHVYPQRTAAHAHNVYLQTWFELGAIGAALLAVFGLTVIAAIARVKRDIRPLVAAGFGAAATIGAFSYGMWQPWFMGSFAVMALMLQLAIAYNRETASR